LTIIRLAQRSQHRATRIIQQTLSDALTVADSVVSSTSGGGSGNTPVDSPMISLRIIAPRQVGTAAVGSTANFPSTDPRLSAYPGVEYNVGAAAIGGAYPYTWSLSGQPSGMTIDADTGVISWPNPDTTTGTLTLTVTDALNATDQETFAVTVTTSGTFFVDNTYADGNGASNGTITRPYKTINAMVTATLGNPTAKVYFRNLGGTPYTFSGGNNGGTWENPNDQSGGGLYLNTNGSTAPECWIGYPGDPIPEIDMQNAGFLRTDKPYMDRLRFFDGREYCWKLSSASDYACFRRCEFDTVTGATGTNRNQGFTFAVNDGPGYYFVNQDCTGQNNNGAEMFGSYYSMNYALVERFNLSNGGYTALHGWTTHIGFKISCNYITIRDGTILIPSSANFWDHYNQLGSNMEICYVKAIKANNATVCKWTDEAGSNIYIYRCNFKGNWDWDGSAHDTLFTKNVMEGTHIDPGSVTFTDNITVAYGTGLIDASGNVTNSAYHGDYGAEIP